MTAPRQVLPNTTYLLTRRCSERRYFLRPSSACRRLFLYILAVAVRRYGMRLHAFCVLSNHVHLIVTDPCARLPAFLQYLDGFVARSFNALLGRWESFWAPGSYSAVTLTSAADVVDKMAYVLANPTAAGLVRRGAEWPGLRSSPASIGGAPLRAKRPKGFFSPDGYMPDLETLEVVPPEGVESLEEFRDQLSAEVKRREDAAADELAREGRAFLGLRAVLAQSPLARPASGEPRRGLRPRVAGHDKWKRVEAILRLKDFLATYRAAWREFRSGVRDAVFPGGTYWMRVAYGVQCAGAG